MKIFISVLIICVAYSNLLFSQSDIRKYELETAGKPLKIVLEKYKDGAVSGTSILMFEKKCRRNWKKVSYTMQLDRDTVAKLIEHLENAGINNLQNDSMTFLDADFTIFRIQIDTSVKEYNYAALYTGADAVATDNNRKHAQKILNIFNKDLSLNNLWHRVGTQMPKGEYKWFCENNAICIFKKKK